MIQIRRIDRIILTEPQGGRTKGVSTGILKKHLSFHLPRLKFHEEKEPSNAMKKLTNSSNEGKLLCIGSLYLIGNLLKSLNLDDTDSMTILRK